MKKTKSMVMGAAVLAALALPMVAGAAGKLVVQDNSTPAVDKFVVTDQGWIGSGLGTGVLPGSGLQISGQALQAPQIFLAHNPAIASSNGGGGIIMFYNNNGALPASNDRLGYLYFGSQDGANRRNVAGIKGFADGTWTTNVSTPAGFAFETSPVNQPGTRYERMRIAADGRLRLSNQPAAPANNATCTVGDLVLDAPNGFLYLCTATNSWKRASFGAY